MESFFSTATVQQPEHHPIYFGIAAYGEINSPNFFNSSLILIGINSSSSYQPLHPACLVERGNKCSG